MFVVFSVKWHNFIYINYLFFNYKEVNISKALFMWFLCYYNYYIIYIYLIQMHMICFISQNEISFLIFMLKDLFDFILLK